MDEEDEEVAAPFAWSGLVVRALMIVVSAAVGLVVQALLSGRFLGGGRSAHARQVASMVTRPTGTRLDDVGGHADAKRELRASVVAPMRRPHVFYDRAVRSVRPPRGVLLHGPPGTGKTMLARAAACEAGVPMLTLHSAALESKWWGETPKLLDAVFRAARDVYAPCLLFMDEIDGLGRARSDQDQNCVYTLKCELFRNIDALDGYPVCLLACTNCPTSLDPALRRRFQRTISIGPPDARDRLSILRTLTAHDAVERGTLPTLARRAVGYTGAELTALYEAATSARMAAVDVGDVDSAEALVRSLGPLTLDHFETAADRVALRRLADDEAPPPSA